VFLFFVPVYLRSNADLQGGPSIDALADSIESAWNSGEFKRAVNLFSAAHKFSASEFRNSFRLVAQLVEFLLSSKLYEEALVAADILVAVHPNLFQAHLYRTRALTMLSLWEAAAQELAVVRRLQPSLQLLSVYEEEISSNAAKEALASQGARAHFYDPVDSYRGNSSSDDVRVADSWSNVIRGLGSREFIPYVIFDAVVCSCFVALYSYMCKIKAATAKAAKCSVAPVAPVAALAHVQPAALLRRSRA
jgi:tetratricopeptide (TPR) repeat protein